MSNTFYFTRQFQFGSDVQSVIETVTDTAVLTISETCAANSTTTLVCSVDVSAVTGIYISVDQDSTTFNPSSGTTATFTVNADAPVFWTSAAGSQGFTNILTDDFTNILVTNGSTTEECNIEMRIIYTV